MKKLIETLTSRLALLEQQDPTARWQEEEPLVTADFLQDALLRDRQAVEEELLPLLVRVIVSNTQAFDGVCPPKDSTSLEDVMRRLQKYACEQHRNQTCFSSLSRHGVHALRSRFPSYWNTLGGAGEVCRSPDLLLPVVAFRIGLNNVNEVYDLTPATLRRGLISARKVPSFFKPGVAAAIYDRSLDGPRPTVWDPSGGFGARMLGFFSVFPEGHYIANEPAAATNRDLHALREEILALCPRATIDIFSTGSEVQGPERPVDLVFTSPPYFDKEKYYDEPGQCWRDYPTRGEWVRFYLVPTLRRAASALHKNGYLVLNVDSDCEGDVKCCVDDQGLEDAPSWELTLGADHFAKARKQGPRSEPILRFAKYYDGLSVDVPGTKGRTQVDSHGMFWQVLPDGRTKLYRGSLQANGYVTVGILYDGATKTKTELAHRLVCRAFHGPPPTPEHTDVCHINGVKNDNRASNLRWGTRSENMLDVAKHREQKHLDLKATPPPPGTNWYVGRTADRELVSVCLRLLQEEKLEIVDIAAILNCSPDQARNLMRGRTGKQLVDEPVPARKRRTKTRKAQICQMIQEGKSREEVNQELGENLTPQAFYYYKNL